MSTLGEAPWKNMWQQIWQPKPHPNNPNNEIKTRKNINPNINTENYMKILKTDFPLQQLETAAPIVIELKQLTNSLANLFKIL